MKKFTLLLFLAFCLLLPGHDLRAEQNYPAESLLALSDSKDAAVYYIGVDGKKYVFPDSKTYFTWYQDFDQVIKVSIEELDQYPDGGAMPYRAGSRLVTHQNTAKIYAVAPDGVLRWLPSAEIASNLYGDDWMSMVQDIIPGYFSSSYTKGEDISDRLPTGTVVQDGNTTNYYYIDGNTKRKFLDKSTLEKNNFRYDYILSRYDLDNYADGEPILDREESIASYYVGSDSSVIDEGNGEEQPRVIQDQNILILTHVLGRILYEEGGVAEWFDNYNSQNNSQVTIAQRDYPDNPYAWSNLPYDYWRLWVEGVCDSSEPTMACLGDLAADYDVVSFTHSYEASDVLANIGVATAGSTRQSIENYQAEYRDLRTLMDNYPDTLFIVWTIPPRHPLYKPSDSTATYNAERANQFADWVKDEWLSEDGNTHDNIKVFDLRGYLADDSGYLKYDYRRYYTWADPFPNLAANEYIGPRLSQFIVDSIENFY